MLFSAAEDHRHPQNGYASRLTQKAGPDLPSLRATRLHHNPISGSTTFLRHTIAWLLPHQVPRIQQNNTTSGITSSSGRLVSMIHHGRMCTGTGISTRCPSTTPVGLALGPDSPWEDELDPGTLSHPAGKILTCQFVTHACILTRTHSTTPHGIASSRARRSPTQQQKLLLPRLRRCT